ncbi:MAG: hypothetical protein ACTHJ0_03535, partial [Flavipsychrobacter sp.]
MKRVFPLIVLLITLSVLGIMFIQMSWIRNAIYLKQTQFEREIQNSLLLARESIYSRFIMMNNQYMPDEDSKEYYLSRKFTSQSFTREELEQIIDKSLKKNGITQPFEFCILNLYKLPIVVTDAFPIQNINTTNSIRLTPEDSYLQETLYLYVKEDKNYIIRKMAGMIAA